MKKTIAVMLVIGMAWSLAEGFGTLQARVPGSNNAYVPIWLKTMNASVTINDQIAVTYINQIFTNPTSSTEEGIYSFSLPSGSVITELALWINGVRTVAKAISSTQATSIYDSSVRKSVDPALLESLGNNNYQIYVYPYRPGGRFHGQPEDRFYLCDPVAEHDGYGDVRHSAHFRRIVFAGAPANLCDY
jgi:Ca-activated chloride channel family protein